jgi:hypothetical protein
MVQQYPTLFQLSKVQKWTLARYVHAFTLVMSRSIEIDLNDLAESPQPTPESIDIQKKSAYKKKTKRNAEDCTTTTTTTTTIYTCNDTNDGLF